MAENPIKIGEKVPKRGLTVGKGAKIENILIHIFISISIHIFSFKKILRTV